MAPMQKFRLACLLLAGVLLYVGFSEYSLSSRAKSEAQRITCEKLAEMGPGDNAHIELSEFFICEYAYVYEGDDDAWTAAWVPVVPRNGSYHQRIVEMIEEGARPSEIPPPDDIRIIVKLTKVKGPRDVTAFGQRPSLKGMVMNRIKSLGGDEKKLLREGYPAINFDHCWLFHEGRTPTSSAAILLMLLVALVAAVVGIWPWLSRLWKEEDSLQAEFVRVPIHPEAPLQRQTPPLQRQPAPPQPTPAPRRSPPPPRTPVGQPRGPVPPATRAPERPRAPRTDDRNEW